MAALAACAAAPVGTADVEGPARADLVIEQLPGKGDQPPRGPKGACWQRDETPAVIETVTEQVLVTPEARDAQGRVLTPAAFHSVTSQRIVQDRSQVWFRAPCPEMQDVAFIASLQRALKARGLYLGEVTGSYDPATAEGVRRFQAERGLDSPVLSLAAARELGLVAVDLERL